MSGHLSLVATTVIPVVPAAAGRHAGHDGGYVERWAERYPQSQGSVERARLKQGKAAHRAHRDPLPAKQAGK